MLGMTRDEAIAYDLALRFTRAVNPDQYDFTPFQALWYYWATENPFEEVLDRNE